MYENIGDYLKEIERNLRSLPEEERIDIIKEIDSNIQEMQMDKNIVFDKVVERLGSPKELAKSYIGNSLVYKKKSMFRKVFELIGFYSMAGLLGIIILPVTSILSITFYGCAIFVPIAGMIKWILSFWGIDIPMILIQLGSFAASPFQIFLISIILIIPFWLLGKVFWKLTIAYIKTLITNKQKLDD